LAQHGLRRRPAAGRRHAQLRCGPPRLQPCCRPGGRRPMNFLIATVLGYVLGSIPFGLLLTRAVGIDIRAVGSGNIGATNVLRTGNRWMAAATLLLDAGKGAAAVLIARYFLAAGADSGLAANFV